MLAVINDTGILVVVLAVVVLFGASRIPKLARSLGEANREFRNATQEDNPAPARVAAPAALEPSSSSTTGSRPGDVITISRADLDDLLAKRNPTSAA